MRCRDHVHLVAVVFNRSYYGICYTWLHTDTCKKSMSAIFLDAVLCFICFTAWKVLGKLQAAQLALLFEFSEVVTKQKNSVPFWVDYLSGFVLVARCCVAPSKRPKQGWVARLDGVHSGSCNCCMSQSEGFGSSAQPTWRLASETFAWQAHAAYPCKACQTIRVHPCQAVFTVGSPRGNPHSFDFHKSSCFLAHGGAAYMNGYFNAEVALNIGGSGGVIRICLNMLKQFWSMSHESWIETRMYSFTTLSSFKGAKELPEVLFRFISTWSKIRRSTQPCELALALPCTARIVAWCSFHRRFGGSNRGVCCLRNCLLQPGDLSCCAATSNKEINCTEHAQSYISLSLLTLLWQNDILAK